MYELYIANKNYSSWSLRPWVLMRELDIPFDEHLLPFRQTALWADFRRISSSGKVPVLVDENCVVWDSLAIVEFLAERYAGVWPSDATARTWARSASAEMHSGFQELRQRCSMTCGQRVRLHEVGRSLAHDIARLGALWNDGLERFGGPFLAGRAFCAVDAFFAPVAFRIQSYNLILDTASAAYARRLLELRSMQAWYAAALEEKMRDEPHEVEVRQLGTILQDLRQR
jgi:glutathione S-transferase